MVRPSRQNQAVRDFILWNVEANPRSVGSLAAKKFGLSRTALSRYVQRLVGEGLLTTDGNTSGRHYALRPTVNVQIPIDISPGLAEDHIWRFRMLPHMEDVARNIVDICQYGFTEMLNNVIDHSESPDALIALRRTSTKITMRVIDHGVGIFEKIKKDFKLSDPRHALLELAKGRLTSNALAHSGEGIFFTGRMFNDFSLDSGHLFYTRARRDADDCLIETNDLHEYTKGTSVRMEIHTNADWTLRDVFDKYQTPELLFRKTHIPIKLALYPGEQLVSRSQAKRLLVRFEDFSEVLLDFQGVTQIGQGFADEIFRVFMAAHPDAVVVPMNTSPEIDAMIRFVQNESKVMSPPREEEPS